ncbi:hypothetical protein CAPTEDRAFT_217547 [Capitella teleta]|uniref:Laminin G domain-containing protein n=1 Tax=Capitella teleta TaxID=283909 RepID=R7TIF9_CAPTE|nr:hypothetical protein CAPTEDRAFT_217547 [Capitella teleta]|eukprot:ELT91301.1 hypothetical protein CAPTEDRAFT_217547 [Capitella teleta]
MKTSSFASVLLLLFVSLCQGAHDECNQTLTIYDEVNLKVDHFFVDAYSMPMYAGLNLTVDEKPISLEIIASESSGIYVTLVANFAEYKIFFAIAETEITQLWLAFIKKRLTIGNGAVIHKKNILYQTHEASAVEEITINGLIDNSGRGLGKDSWVDLLYPC